MKKLIGRLSDFNELGELEEHNLTEIKKVVLYDAIRTAFGLSSGGRKRKALDEAWLWLNSEEREGFSFKACCSANGINSKKLLEKLRWQRRTIPS